MANGNRRHTRQISRPVYPVVTVAEMREHASGIPANQWDTLIAEFIEAATEEAQDDCWRQFLLSTYETRLNDFSETIYLPRPPLNKVLSVDYISGDGVQTRLVEGTDYQVDTHGEPGIIRPARHTTWPTVLSDTLNAVTIRYQAGYSTTSDDPLFPAQAKMLVKFLAMQLIQRRAPVTLIQGIVLEPNPYTYEDMLDKLKFRDSRVLDFA